MAPAMNRAKKNVLLLATCQATFNTGQALMLTAAPFIGLALAADKSLATLPIAIQFGATLVATMPASFLMKHIGRRPGFLIGAMLGMLGSAVAAYGIFIGSFVLFCVGLAINGTFNGFATFYRFAAADAAGPDYTSRAISYVLAGGVIAAFLGPNLARWTADSISAAPFAGTYIALIGVYSVALLALLFVDIPQPTQAEQHHSGRPLTEIARQPTFVVAVLGAMICYGVMNLIMTSTPLALHHQHYPFSDAAFVIQWHVLGMFAPSFITGRLIARYGVLNIMLSGAVLCVACAVTNLAGNGYWQIWSALVLLGIGWNFLFIGATTLLTETYRVEEKAKVQAINDFIILGTVTITAFSSGPIHHNFGWQTLNTSVIPAIVLVAVAIAWLKRRRLMPVTVTSG
jgi:MFS family permease